MIIMDLSLKAIIALTICCMEQTNEFVYLVGLSATLPNFQDVVTFLHMNEKKAIKCYQVMNQVYYGISLLSLFTLARKL